MKKLFTRLSLLCAGAGMLVTSGIVAGKSIIEDDFEDPITYASEPIKYQHTKRADDEDEPVAVDVKKVTLHYHNDDGKCGDRAFYLWATGVDGIQFAPDKVTGTDMEIAIDFSADKYKDLKNKFDLRLIIKFKSDWNGQSDDTIIVWNEFPPNDAGETVVWMVPGIGSALECYKTEEETKSDKVTESYFANFKKIHVVCTAAPGKYRLYSYDQRYLAMGNNAQAKNKETRLLKEGESSKATFDITLKYNAHINMQYVLETEYPNYPGKVHSIVVPMHKFYSYDGADDTKKNITRFDKYYTYSGDDLGVTYTKESSTFKVWAPTAGLVKLNIYENGTALGDDAKEGSDVKDASYQMVYMPGGVWACTLEGDLNGFYYTYTVYNSLGRNEVVDPYAKACGANGRRGMILDFESTNPEGWNFIHGKWDGKTGYDITTPQQLAIYESHIRDLTMHESWQSKKNVKRGTYAAYVEKGTTYTKNIGTTPHTVRTGFDHLRELGVNAIQFTPVYDHDNTEFLRTEILDKDGNPVVDKDGNPTYKIDEGSYNWGYNPLNYNCVEGQYSTNPNDGAQRVKEFKQMIYDMATSTDPDHPTTKRPIRAIMDVVYNHVSSGPNSNFTKLMPRYYFRYTDNNAYWNKQYNKKKGQEGYIEPDQYFNGSGCSNEVKTEAKMMRKFIVESLCWWAKEYNIKGFRFDLMGLIDVVTLQEAAKALYKIDPDIYIYGEGWTGDGGDAHVDQSIYNSSTGDYKKTWGANTYCTYRDLRRSLTGGLYVGAFNDTGRNGIRGGNDRAWDDGKGSIAERTEKRRPGWGFMSQDSSHVGDNGDKVKAMMLGDNSGCGASKASDSAKQTVNYASCHDNYSLFDQFSATVGVQKAYNICRATTSTNMAIMMSNGVAFMQGGEELFRTKIVSKEDAAKIRLPEDYVTINGINIAHNAYKSPDSTNAFDYGRKISVTYGSETCTYCEGYFAQLAKVIKERPNLAYKDSPSSSGDPSVWTNGTQAAGVCYYIGIKGASNSGYNLLLSGEASGNTLVGGAGTYTEFAAAGEKSISGSTITSSEMYSCIVYRFN